MLPCLLSQGIRVVARALSEDIGSTEHGSGLCDLQDSARTSPSSLSACLGTLRVLVLARALREVPVLVGWSVKQGLLCRACSSYPRQSKAQAAGSAPYISTFSETQSNSSFLLPDLATEGFQQTPSQSAFQHSSPATRKAVDSIAWTDKLWFGCWVRKGPGCSDVSRRVA